MSSILIISRCPPYPLHFGDRLIIWHLARELSQRGAEIDLLALQQFDTDADEINHYQHFFRDVTLFPERKRTPLMYLQRLLGNHYPNDSQQAWQPDLWQTIEQRLVHHNYDAVHLFGGVHVYEFANLLKNIPTVITPYESYTLYLKRAIAEGGGVGARINHFFARQFEQWMFTPYDVTTVLTVEDKTELLSINPNLNVKILPNGVDLNQFVPEPIERDEATLLFVGNYEYPPNHDAALVLAQEIFPKVQAIVPNAKLQLVGNAPSDQMKALQSDAIDVTGRVPSVQTYLNRATVFVCPLRVGAGIKNKVLEALAMGIPTIATPLSMEGIAIEEGHHALVASTSDMPSKIAELLSDSSLQAKLSTNSRELIVNQYSWHSVVNQYQAMYQKAMTFNSPSLHSK